MSSDPERCSSAAPMAAASNDPPKSHEASGAKNPAADAPLGTTPNPHPSLDTSIIDVKLAQFNAGVALVIHEDRQNYVKLHNFLLLSGALLAVFGWTSATATSPVFLAFFRYLVCLIGIASAVGFGAELASGILCISCHRRTVEHAEDSLGLAAHTGTRTLTSSPRRMLLRWAAPVIGVAWLLLLEALVICSIT